MTMPSASTHGGVLHWARAYDALAWVLTLGRESEFREHLLDLARLAEGESVLDVGCGTGTTAIAARGRVGSGGSVAGVDPSPEMVQRAHRKAAKAGVDVRFDATGVETLPFADSTFDAVLATLMLHHLTEDGRSRGLAEITRVLKPGGRFLAVDIGGETRSRPGLFFRLRRHAGFDLLKLVPALESAGLTVLEEGPVGGPRLFGLSGLRFILSTTSAGR
jgi:ubiquinone/menaquinone biosynthesis C-methylase UbiE